MGAEWRFSVTSPNLFLIFIAILLCFEDGLLFMELWGYATVPAFWWSCTLFGMSQGGSRLRSCSKFCCYLFLCFNPKHLVGKGIYSRTYSQSLHIHGRRVFRRVG